MQKKEGNVVKKGKKLKYSDNPEGGETLPTIAENLMNQIAMQLRY